MGPNGKGIGPSAAAGEIRIRGNLGKEQITLFASDVELPSFERLRCKEKLAEKGEVVSDLVVHSFYKIEKDSKGRFKVVGDVDRLVKKTIEIETR